MQNCAMKVKCDDTFCCEFLKITHPGCNTKPRCSKSKYTPLILVTKLLNSDWLRAVSVFCKHGAKTSKFTAIYSHNFRSRLDNKQWFGKNQSNLLFWWHET